MNNLTLLLVFLACIKSNSCSTCETGTESSNHLEHWVTESIKQCIQHQKCSVTSIFQSKVIIQARLSICIFKSLMMTHTYNHHTLYEFLAFCSEYNKKILKDLYAIFYSRLFCVCIYITLQMSMVFSCDSDLTTCFGNVDMLEKCLNISTSF